MASVHVGDLIQGGGTIAAGSTYVAAVNTSNNTLALSNPVSIAANRGVLYLHQGATTVSLDANAGTGPIPSSNTPTLETPGTTLASFTIYGAYLPANNPGVTSSPESYTFALPFGSTQLNPSTAYWIGLSDLPTDPAPTNYRWELVLRKTGKGVTGNEKKVLRRPAAAEAPLDERGAVAADDADHWIRQGCVHHVEFSLRPVLVAD